MDPSIQRMQILDMIDQGRISPEEGLNLLQMLAAGEDPGQMDVIASEPLSSPTTEMDAAAKAEEIYSAAGKAEIPTTASLPENEVSSNQQDLAPEIRKWKRWWLIPLFVGIAVAIFGGLFMYQAQVSSGYGFWFFCASVPFLLGLIIIGLAWQSRTAPWLHLRVKQQPGQRPARIAFSMPLPIRPVAWLVRVFKRWAPGMQDRDWEQMLYAVGRSTSPENPLFIQVDEGKNGEKVEIYIG